MQQMLVEPLVIKVDYFHVSRAAEFKNASFDLINLNLN